MEINVVSETVTFTGSTSGTPFNNILGDDYVEWHIGGLSILDTDLDVSSSFTQGGTSTLTFDENSLTLRLTETSGADFSTATANSISIAYTSLSLNSAQKNYINTLDGATIALTPITGGSGYESINVSVVPETRDFALLLGVSTLLLTELRRRKSSK